jgi:DNA-binding response OmpR family regulator
MTTRIPVLVVTAEDTSDRELRLPPRAELFCKSLERASAGDFSCEPELFDPADDNALFAVRLNVETVTTPIVIYMGARRRQHRLFAFLRRLRTERCTWNPLHVFADGSGREQEEAEDWCIWLHDLPPRDYRATLQKLHLSHPVPSTVRSWFVVQALRSLGERLQRLVEPLDRVGDAPHETLVPQLRALSGLVAADPHAASAEAFLRDSAELLLLPSLSEEDSGRLLSRIGTLERGQAPLSSRSRSALHTLKNRLLLARWRPSDARSGDEDAKAQTEDVLLHGLPALDPRDAQPLEPTVDLLRSWLLRPSGEVRADQLTAAAATLQTTAHHLASRIPPEGSSNPQRLLLVEDDPDWRARLRSCIDALPLAGRVKVEEAGTVDAARQLLRNGGAAVVIVDLGLPLDEQSAISLDGGLRLIEEFTRPQPSGRLPQHTFLILTGGETLGRAVEKALLLGVAASGYLLKDSLGLEAELEARLNAAFRRKHPVKIDLFRTAPRLIHIDGNELTLELPLWTLLMALAESHQFWSPSAQLAGRMSMPPFSLDPSARDEDATDPSDRIERQLPKYRSDLNLRLVGACKKIRGEPPPETIVEFDDELGYRLNADVRVLGRVPYFPPDRRPRVLVVEDSIEWSRSITAALQRNGYDVAAARTLEAARNFASDAIDLITLDLELPDNEVALQAGDICGDGGLRYLSWLREHQYDVPVVLLTGTNVTDGAMLPLLKAGLRYDDYLSKHDPEPIRRLLASVERLWRETLARCRILDWDPTSVAHPITIDRSTGVVAKIAGYPIKAAGLGHTLLSLLSSRPNTFVGRSELIDTLFPDPDQNLPDDPEKALDQHIKRVRKTIGDQTEGTVNGSDVVCGGRGIYWLRGIVQYSKVGDEAG